MKLERLFIFCVWFLFFCCDCIFAGGLEDPEIRRKAGESYDLFRSTVSSPGMIEKNYVSPLLGNVTMYTIDRSKPFLAQILCPSAEEFLNILVQPAQTGDLNIQVFVDTNRDGRMDRQFVFNNISGICANGFISCNPGTWNNCTFYLIQEDNGDLVLSPVSYDRLGGCFCVNNYCGENLFWRNTAYVLNVIGGAVVQAFQQKDPSFTVSSGVIEGASIRFYAQDVGECLRAGGGSEVRRLADYKDNPYDMSSASFSLFESERKNPQSLAYYVADVSSRTSEIFEERSCTVKRVVETRTYSLAELFSHATDCFGNIPGPYECGNRCAYFEFGVWQEYHGGGSATIDFEMTPDFYNLISEIKAYWRTDTTGPYPCFDDDGYINFYLNGQFAGGESYGDSEAHCGCCSRAPSHWVVLNKGFIIPPSDDKSSVINTLQAVAGGMGGGYGVNAGCRPIRIYFYLTGDFKGCYITKDYVEDMCTSLNKDSNCILWYEKIDDVVTYMNGQKTGLTPLLKCQAFCDRVICDRGWIIERRYRCKASGVDFSDAERRLSAISSTTDIDLGSGVLSFTDERKEGGIWKTYTNQRIIFGNTGLSDDCEPVCRVKVSSLREVEQNVSLRGQTSGRSEFLYRPCILQDSKYVCPVQEGEVLDADCTCASFFGEAAAALQAIRLAGSDFICSSGIEKSF